ncbi:MFS transporter [Ectothiorhodospira shaposhnikovii]|nr:MFS transporter [Ectothiorhodospira shaposhnikovii]
MQISEATGDDRVGAGDPGATPFSLKPLMFQSFVCTMAMMTFTALAGPIGRSLGLAPWNMGLAVTAGGIAWILTARAWGNASDRHGRRPVLLSGLGGFAIAYAGLCLITALALEDRMPALMALAGLVIGRTLTGGFFSAVPTAGAAMIADHVPPDRRTAAMGALGMASASAMVIGPAVAGLVAPYDLVLPLLVAAALPVVAFAASWSFLPRTGKPIRSVAQQPPPLTDPRLRRPAVVAFVSMLAVATAQMVIGFYALDRLGLSPQEGARVAGIALACVGVALILGQTMVRVLRWPPEFLIRLGAAIAALAFFGVAFATTAILLYLCYFVAAAGMGLLWPSVSALAANAVQPHEQGAAAGTITTAQGLGSVIGPLLGTTIYSVAITAPYMLIALLLAVLIPWRIDRSAN